MKETRKERCKCEKVETYKENWAGDYICTKCEKKLKDKDINAICIYYGWN